MPHVDLSGINLGSLGTPGYATLAPGVYYFSSTTQLLGALTLDFSTNPGGQFVFQVGTALTTGSASSVNVINGSSLSQVYWLMGVTGGSGTGSATLGSGTAFAGNILALDSIWLNSTAEILCGRAIALNAEVTMINNKISNNNTAQDFGSGRSDFGSYGFNGSPAEVLVPEPSIILQLGLALAGLVAFIKWSNKA